MKSLSSLDIFAIFLYFAAVFAAAVWAVLSQRKDSQDYFLAGRSAGWLAVGASLFVSNIGSEHLVGLAGAGAAGGLAVGHFEWLASLTLLALGWIFVPVYMRTKVTTMPEFLELRFNSACRWYFSLISIVGYVLTKISVSLYAGGLIIQEITNVNLMVAAAFIVILTGGYTIVGGLRAVIYTDMLQAVTLLLGSCILIFLCFAHFGDLATLRATVGNDYFSMWRPMSDSEFPWTGIVFGAPILGVWYWCTDQYIVQRVLAARSLDDARSATILTGYLKILPVFLFVLPGIFAAAMFPELLTSPDQALPVLINNLMPSGLKGIMLAAILAALMSSLSAVFNSCSTLVTYDIYLKLRPEAEERQLINFGRLATVILVGLGLAWIPLMKYISGQLFIYLQSIQGYIAPPIAAAFIFGLFFTRINGQGAILALAVGFALGMSRLILEILVASKTLVPSDSAMGHILGWFTGMNFLHFAAMLFIVCGIILFVGSLGGEAAKTSWLDRKPEATFSVTAKWVKWTNIAASIALILIVATLWWVFA